MKIQLIDVGRNKVNKTCEIDTTRGTPNDGGILAVMEGVVAHYLMSSDIEVMMNKNKTYDVVVGGFRKVGEIKLLEL